jgi:hypothetical protein
VVQRFVCTPVDAIMFSKLRIRRRRPRSFSAAWLVVVMAVMANVAAGTRSYGWSDDAPLAATHDARPELALTIDAALEQAWTDAGISPADEIGDDVFVRRVYLDLAGRIPSTDERAAFLNDPSSDRRQALLTTLLASEDHALHMADVFDVLLMGRASGRRTRERHEHGWRAWLENAFRDNRPWNEMAETMLLARPATPEDNAAAWFLYERDNDYQKIAEAVAPAFFGFRIECAQCHDSMTAAEVEQAHYWGLVAFFNRGKNEMTGQGPRIVESAIGGFSEFADIEGSSSPNLLSFLEAETVEESRPAPDAEQADTDDLYQPAARDGEPREPIFSRRQRFVEDIVHDHPLLARAMVNRLWAMLMGRGLVHPFDEMDSAHSVSHPELLDLLADDFRKNGHDIRRTLLAIASTRAYQRAARKPTGVEDPATFAWYLERPLTAEQFARSLHLALLGTSHVAPEKLEPIRRAMPDVMPDESVTGIAEPLFLSNGEALLELIQQASQPPHPLATLATLPSAAKVTEQLFLSTLGRQPTPEETTTIEAFLTGQAASAASGETLPIDLGRLRDLAWALVTSAEFRFNH